MLSTVVAKILSTASTLSNAMWGVIITFSRFIRIFFSSTARKCSIEHVACQHLIFLFPAGLALNLLCGDPALCRAHLKHGVKPKLQAGSGLLKNRSGEWVDVISAVIARVGGSARHAVVLALNLTLRAGGNAAREAHFFDGIKAGIVVRKLRIELNQRVFLRLCQYVVSALNVAHVEIMPFLLLVVKG